MTERTYMIKIGFSQLDITPLLGTAMCGQVFKSRAKGVESKLLTELFAYKGGQLCAQS